MTKASKLQAFLFGVCACVNLGIPFSLLMSLNMLFTDWLTYFQADRGTTSAVQATCFGVMLGAGVFAGMLEWKLGERRSLLLGSFLSAVGLFSGSFAPSLPALILCVGVVAGSGFCLLHLSSISTALRRFPKKAGFMSSTMSATAGLFHLTTPLLFRFLSDEYTWRGSLLFASAIALHSAIMGLLLTSPLLRPTPAPSSIPLSFEHDTPCATENLQSGDTNKLVGLLTHDENKTNKTSPENDKDDAPHRTNVITESECDDIITPPEADHDGQNKEPDLVLIAGPGENSSTEPRVSFVHKTESDLQDAARGAEADRPETDPGHHQPFLLRDSGEPDDDSERNAFLQSGHHTSDNHEDVSLTLRNASREKREDSKKKRDRSGRERLKKNGSFLTSPLYLCIVVHTMVIFSTIFRFLLFVLDYAGHRRWTVQDRVLLNFVFMLSGLISQALAGVVSLHARVSSMVLLIGAGVIGSVGLCLVGQVTNFALAAVVYACMALGYGVTVGLAPSVALDVTGPRNYPLALGLMYTVEGVMDALMGDFTGVLADLLQSYSLLSLAYGIASLASCVSLLVVYRCCR